MRTRVSEKPIATAVERLVSLLRDNYGRPTLLMLSGGSAFRLIDGVPADALCPHLTICMLDERFSADEAISNFSQLAKTGFFARAKETGCAFIDTRVLPGETLAMLAKRFEGGLRAWREGNPDGSVIATMGMGPDGHTAGIMPFPDEPGRFDALFEGGGWAVGYDASGKSEHPLRVTVTNAFLRSEVAHAVAYVSGEGKRDALSRALSEGPLNDVPARIMHSMRDVGLHTDVVL